MKRKILLTIFMPLALSACFHSPTPGEKMMAVSKETQSLSDQWTKGDKLIAEGNKLVSKGQKKVASGNDDLSSGKDLIEEGKEKIAHGLKLKKQSEVAFKKHFPGYNSGSVTTQASGLDQQMISN